jgi:hypothetical protein
MKFISLLVAALAFGGCGGGDSVDDSPDITDEGTIFEYSRAGGFAFSVYEISIDADGAGVARFGSDVHNLDEQEFELAPSEIENLQAVLEENPISSLPEHNDMVCADCFEYTYAYGGDKVSYDDASPPPEELDPVGDILADLPLPSDQPNSR